MSILNGHSISLKNESSMRARNMLLYILSLLLLIGLSGLILSSIGRDNDAFIERINFLQLASELTDYRGSVYPNPAPDTSVWLGHDANGNTRGQGSATWTIPVKPESKIFEHSYKLSARIVIDVMDKERNAAAGSFDIAIDDHYLQHIEVQKLKPVVFGAKKSDARDWLVLNSDFKNNTVQSIHVYSLNIPQHDLIPNHEFKIQLVAHNVAMQVRQVGIEFTFNPAIVSPWNKAAVIIPLACLELGVFFFCMIAIIRSIYYLTNLQTTIGVFIVFMLASVTHDPVDFWSWMHFINMVLFAGTNPSLVWSATPLWAWIPSIAAPIVGLAPLLNVPIGLIETICIKMLEAGAWLLSVLMLFRWCSAKATRYHLAIAMMPLSIFIIAFGARDLVSVCFLLVGIDVLKSKKYLLAALLISCSVSVTEYFLPLLALPTFVAFQSRERKFIPACFYGIFSVSLIALQWLMIDPSVSSHSIAFRVARPPMGGAAWQCILSAQSMLSSVQVLHAVKLGTYSYASLFIVTLFFALWNATKKTLPQNEAVVAQMRFLLPGVAAFFICYSGIDRTEWYGILMLFSALFALGRGSRVPLTLFSSMGFVAYYIFVGFRSYVAPEFGKPLISSMFAQSGSYNLGLGNAVSMGLIAVLIASVYAIIANKTVVGRYTPALMIYLFFSLLAFVECYNMIDAMILFSVLAIAITSILREKSEEPNRFIFAPIDCILIITIILAFKWGAPTLAVNLQVIAFLFTAIGVAIYVSMVRKRVDRLL